MAEKAVPREEASSSGVGVEAVLAREAGSLGRHEIRVLIFCVGTALLSAFGTNEFVFTSRRLNTRCLIPECENPSENLEFAPPWILNAVPASGDSFADCQRFANNSTIDNSDDVCPARWFNRDDFVNCDEHVFETTNTAVYDLGLACDEWRRSMIGSVRTIGAMFALPAAGFVSDRWGRRTALQIFAFNTAWMGLLRYFSSNYIGFVISTFMESALGAGAILASGYVLVMEIVPAKYRVQCGALSNSGFALGQVTLGLIAWAIPYWRHLTLAIYAPQLVSVLYYWMFPESIRWYLSKGRYDDAEEALKKIAKTNGREIPIKSLLELRQAAVEQNIRESTKNEVTGEEPWLIALVFQHKPILLRCIISPIWWITMTLIYYGLAINAVNISGNPYVNYIVVSAIEVPGFIIATLLVQRIGRKLVLMLAYWICAAGQIAYIFIPTSQFAASLTVYLASKFGISMVVTTLYLYTSEIYPTRYRQTLFAYSSMMGRVGSIVAPLTPALGAMVWDQLPFALFAGFALVSGGFVLLTPETMGSRLPDTMQEAADIGTKLRAPHSPAPAPTQILRDYDNTVSKL